MIFSFRRLTHHYGRTKTLDIASLDIPEGAVAGFVGPNGSGKSTLLKVSACLLVRSGGESLYRGVSVDGRERDIRMEVTMLLQDPFLLKRSVYENIAYGLRLRGIPEEKIRERAEASLREVGLEPELFAHRPWFRLSGGEASRVALAVRLSLEPRVLILDEPTASVDEHSEELIREAVRRVVETRGASVLISTHDRQWLDEIADMTITMRCGIVESVERHSSSVVSLRERMADGEWSGPIETMTIKAGDEISMLDDSARSGEPIGTCEKRFKENILTHGLELSRGDVGRVLRIGGADLEVISVGKRCYSECPLVLDGSSCALKDSAVFVRAVSGGTVEKGSFVKFASSSLSIDTQHRSA